MNPKPTEEARSQVSLRTVFTVCFGVLGVVAVVLFIAHSLLALTLTITAMMIAIALDHGVSFLVRRGLRRWLAIVILIIVGLGIAVGLAFTIIPSAFDQGRQLMEHAPQLWTQVQKSRPFHYVDDKIHIDQQLKDSKKHLPEAVQGAAAPLFAIVSGLLSGVGGIISIAVLAIFMLVFGGGLIQSMLKEALPQHQALYSKVLRKIYDLIGGYLGGLTLICAINATLTSTFLAIIQNRFFLPLGILSGFSSLIPYAGPFVAGASVSLIVMATGGVLKGVAAVIYFILYGQLEGNVLGPLIFRRTVHVNPLLVTLSILFIGEIGGIVGAILAVPITAALQIIGRELLRVRRERLHLQRTPLNSPTETG